MDLQSFVKKTTAMVLTAVMGIFCFGSFPAFSMETNVALHKPVTAGIYDHTWTKKAFLNDGDESTLVHYGGTETDNADGVVSTVHDAWYQIDLEAKYEIQRIVLKFSEGYTYSTNRNFKISVSNSEDFSDSSTCVLAEVDGYHPCGNPYTVSGNGEYYRYVRLERIEGKYSNLGYEGFSELEVWAEEEDVIHGTLPSPEAINVALNKSITAGNWSAANPKQNLNDGNGNTYVNEKGALTDNKGSASNYTKGENWYQIDLGYHYAVECIRLYDSTNFWSSGYNISIKLSNNADFSDATEIFCTKEYELAEFPLEIICNRKYYRYIRLEKLNTDMNLEYAYSELEVLAREDSKIGIITENVAVGKPILAGMWDEYCPKTNLNDGDYNTYVYPGTTRTDNQDNKVSTSGTAWYLIDLEQEYTVTGINLYRYRDDWAGHNFRILASKKPEFDNPEEYDVIADTGLNGYFTLPLKVTVPEKEYRYVRFEKLNGTKTSFDYTELEVMGYLPKPELQISEPVFVDLGSGEVVYNPLSVNPTGVRVSAKNYSATPKKVMLFLSLYDKSGKLLACNALENTISVGKTRTLQAGVSTEAASDGCWLKAFLWEGNQLTPLLDTRKLQGQNKRDIYVSSTGSDSADGSFSSPFKTIARAKEEVKKYNQYMSDDIDVYLRGGIYPQEKELVFDETDSGYNGFSVNYQAYQNEKVILSGGIPVNAWTPFRDGIYQTVVNGVEDIRELYVDGVKQKRAQSEEKITPLGFYKENGIITGFRLPSSVKLSEQPESVQLHFDRVYNTYVLNATEMKRSGNEVIVKLQQPQFDMSRSQGLLVQSTSAFYLENSFSELDTAGEFYYDKEKKILYYMPESEKNIQDLEIYVPVLEKLLTVKGSSLANKAKNITFAGLTFTHTTDLELSEIGLMIRQAQEKFLADERGTAMTASSVTLEACENITLKDNVFTGMSLVGLGLKNGAVNSKITGNVFYDIGDSAITIGTSGDAYMEIPSDGLNLAYQKPTTATSPGSAAAVDGIVSNANGWDQMLEHCDTCNSCSTKCNCEKCDYTKGYWQVDLGQPEQIDRIEIDARKGLDQVGSRRYFEVLGSNDPNFQEGVHVLGRCNQDIFPVEGTWKQNVMSSEKYRYVRVRKTVDEYFFLADIRLIRLGETFEKHKEVCLNNLISNNYITNVGDYNHSAPGIQAYYTESLTIQNNLVENVPYSGIALGWGWDSHLDSVTAKNNTIANNVVDTFGRMIIDGAGIYVLGQQPGSKMYGNYIKNQVNECGAIYPDDGSRYWEIYDNVIENADMWMFIWSDNKKDINVYHNFTTTPVLLNAGVNCNITDTTVFIPKNYPTGAMDIIQSAGLTAKYADLPKKVNVGLTYPKDSDIYSNILNGGREISRIRSHYLNTQIQTAESILALASENEYPKAAISNLESVLKTAKIYASFCSSQKAIELRQQLQTAIAEFCNQKQ